MELGRAVAFRVTRNSEYEIDDDEVEDLLKTIEEDVASAAPRARRPPGDRGRRARRTSSSSSRRRSTSTPADVYPMPGLLDLTGLFQIHGLPGYPAPARPAVRAAAGARVRAVAAAPWPAIRARDILVHHPYESFAPVVDFIEAAANDDRVLAIKQTLYRTSSDSPIVRALQRAADNGKQVTAVIELKARLDEERNILWAQRAGKVRRPRRLRLRRPEDALQGRPGRSPRRGRRHPPLRPPRRPATTTRRRPASTPTSGFFTCNPDFCDDVSALFNYLTGYCELPQWRKLVVAPSRLQTFMIEKIEHEAANQTAGKTGTHHRQDQRPARAGRRAGALPGQPGRREDRPHLPRHLLAAARHARRQRQHPRHLHRRSLPRAQPHLLLRATPATRRCTSARPTGWTAT